MIALIQNMSAQRSRELRADGATHRLAARARRNKRYEAPSEDGQLAIRRIDSEGPDHDALERVAGRDSAAAPSGEVIGAVRDGNLVAAVSLTTGELVADPFVPTTEARALLRHRADRLRDHAEGRRPTSRPAHPSPAAH